MLDAITVGYINLQYNIVIQSGPLSKETDPMYVYVNWLAQLSACHYSRVSTNNNNNSFSERKVEAILILYRVDFQQH